jgi:hypothetical protein
MEWSKIWRRPREMSGKELVRKVDMALELARKSREVKLTVRKAPDQPQPQSGTVSVYVAKVDLGPLVISAPRVCSVTKKNYLSHYTRDDLGEYFYSRSGTVTREMELSLKDVRREDVRYKLNKLGFETCPHCGTSAYGAIYCFGCQARTCWGSMIDNQRSRCVCGQLGSVVGTVAGDFGIVL